VGASDTGTGDGSSVDDLIDADDADALTTSANTIFVLVGTAINQTIGTDADGFTLATGQSLVSFANGAAVALGSPPPNVTGVNVVSGATQADPFGFGAPTLDNTLGGSAIDLADGNIVSNLIVASNATAIDGTGGIAGFNSSGVEIRGAATGLFLDGALGTLTIDNLNITGPVQSGIVLANTAATVNFTGTTTVAGAANAGLLADNFDGTASFADLDIAGGAGTGITILNGSSGALTFGAASSIANTGGAAFSVGGSTVTVNYNGTITQNNAASAVRVDAMTGGSVTFGGLISASTGTADAIALTGNAGAAINFNGLQIATTSGVGFNATGGGTISVAGAGNTIATQTGRILAFTDVSVGAGGVSFASLASTGIVFGDSVLLSNVDGGAFSGGAVTVADTDGAGSNGIEISGGSAATFNFASATIDNTSGHGINLNGAIGAVAFTTVDIDGTAGRGIDIDSPTGAVSVGGGTIGATSSPTGFGIRVANQAAASAITLTDLAVSTTDSDALTVINSAGTVTINGGSLSHSGVSDALDIDGGAATVAVSAAISHSGSGQAVEIDGTSGAITISGDVMASGGSQLFAIGNITAPTAGTISFTGTNLTATGGGNAVVAGLGAGAALDVTAALSITGATGNALSVSGVAGTVDFGAVTLDGSGGNGILVNGNSGALTFGTTNVALGASGNTAGIRVTGANADVTFGQTTIAGVGAGQTGIDFTGSDTTATFGVTAITGTGALTGRGIDLSSTLNNRVVNFATGSSIANIGIGVDLSSGQTTATTANANFTFGDGSSAVPNGRNSTIAAAAGGFTVNTVGLDPTSGTYDFDDVSFTGDANLVVAPDSATFVSQNGGQITVGDFGLSQTINTISLADADALTAAGTIFAFVGPIDFAAAGFDLDAGQSITGFGNGNIVSFGTIQPTNVFGNLGSTGGGVTGNEAIIAGTDTLFTLAGGNEIRHTTFDLSSGVVGSAVFAASTVAAGNDITIEGVTIIGVGQGRIAFDLTNVASDTFIQNNDIAIAGTLLDVSGGSGDITITRGMLPNGGPAGTLTAGRVIVDSRAAGSAVTFADQLTLSSGAADAVLLTGNAGAAVSFAGLDITATTGRGFVATGGTISVGGADNTISTTTGTAIDLSGVAVGSGGINFATVGVNGAATGINLTSVTSAGGGIVLGTVDLQNVTSRGVDINTALGAALSISDLDISLNNSAAIAFDLNGAALSAAVTAEDLDVTNAAAAGTSIGVDLRGTTGGQIVRLGDATVANPAFSSIAGVNTGVFLNAATNAAFIFGDGESATNQQSTISAIVGIDATSAPVAGTYNFQDVGFAASPGNGFGVGDIYFVAATATGDGSGRDASNRATLATAEAASGPEDVLVLIDDGGIISAAGSNGNDTLVLDSSEQVRGFGNGTINLALTVPSTIQLASTNIAIADPTGGGAATLTTSAGNNAITLGASGNRIDGFILDGNPAGAARGLIDNGAGATGTTISNMTIRNFDSFGIEITPSTNTTIDNVIFSGNASDVFLNAAGTTITNVTSTGATGVAFRLDNVSGTTTLTNISISGAAGGGISFGGVLTGPTGTVNAANIDIAGTGGAALSIVGGNATFNFAATSSIDITTGTAVSIADRAGGSFTFAGTVVSNGAANGISVSGATASNTVSFTGAVDLGVGTRLTGEAVSLANVNTTTSFSNIDIVTSGTTGFSATGGGTVNVTAGTVNATTAQAVNLSGVAAGINFASTTSTGGTQNVSMTNVTGTVNLGAGALSGATGSAFSVSGGSANIDYNGSITHSGNAVAVLVQNHTGTGGGASTISFDGAITSNGSSDGIGLASNGGTNGTTINFTNTLTINTSASNSTGFSATGGGTVTATGAGNTINSGSGTALNVVNTNIGAAGVTFQSISSSGAASGIVLNNTGTTAGVHGGLTVTGDGGATANGSGGVINGSTGAGILLASTRDVSLDQINVTNGGDDGIHGVGVVNFTLNRSNITGNGNSTTDDGLQFGEAAGAVVGVTGNVSILASSISGNAHNNVHIRNTSGTIANLTVTNSSFNNLNDTSGANSFLFEASGTSTITEAFLTGNTFANNSPQRALEVQAHDTATISDFVVSGNTFNANGIHASFTQDGSSNLEFYLVNNNITTPNTVDNVLQAVNVFSSSQSTGGTIVGTISGNTINTNQEDISGISIVIQGRTDATLLIDNNDVTGAGPFGNRGITVAFRGPTAALGPQITHDVTITNNVVDNVTGGGGFALAAISVEADNQSGSFATAPIVRADIRGNTVPGTAAFDLTSGHIQFYEYDGDGTPNEGQDGIGQLINTTGAANATAQLSSTNTGSVAAVGIDLIAGPINTPPPVPTPLMAASGGVEAIGEDLWGHVLTGDTLDSLIAAAIERWAATGLSDEQLAALNAVTFEIADLDGNYLGLAEGNHVRLDDDGNGAGWYVDATPLTDEEFANQSSDTQLLADGTQAPAGQYDLLTTIMHEMGHVLGIGDTYATDLSSTLMYGWLTTGERRLPNIIYSPQDTYYSASLIE
ncbi:hypothetical protein MAXJ12_26878, partial [Mesorhizobium alhagi CCNWXJ12-2]